MLIVEDDPALRGVLARGLREQGAVVTAVADGSSALSRFADDSGFDVVVMDVGLPDSDGRDVCQALRARGVHVPVLFLTARGNITDLVSGFAAGG
ncbi:response regulator transcription factor, partial [Frankia sp. CiP3]